MNYSVLRLLLVVLGWPGVVVSLFLGYDAYVWVRAQYPMTPPVEHINTARVQHPFYHTRALAALAAFKALPQAERKRISIGLSSDLMPLTAWLARLRHADYGVLCFGEDHTEETRRFLASDVVNRLPTDALLLETTPEGLARIERRLDDHWPYYPLHGVDIAALLRATRRLNPAVRIAAIDQTPAEQVNDTLRDVSINANFWRQYRPGRHYLLLFGAFHCSSRPGWLYHYLQNSAPANLRMLNVRVLGEHQDGPLEGLVYFLDELGLIRGDFAVVNTARLDTHIRAWFPELAQDTLSRFRCLLVFRNHVPAPTSRQSVAAR
ncbi:MAG: hypothetical protein WB783_02140 [Arenicellales bacterium]